jgi:hypothetical protein
MSLVTEPETPTSMDLPDFATFSRLKGASARAVALSVTAAADNGILALAAGGSK